MILGPVVHFQQKNFFFQNGVCCRKEVANDVMFCGNMSEGMLVNHTKFGEIRRNRLRDRRRNVKSQDGGRAADRK